MLRSDVQVTSDAGAAANGQAELAAEGGGASTPPLWDDATQWVLDLTGGNYWLIVLVVLATAWLAKVAARWLMVTGVGRLTKKTSTAWDNLLVEHKVFRKLSKIAPAIVIYGWAGLLFAGEPGETYSLAWWAQTLTAVYMILVGGTVVAAFFDAGLDAFEKTKSVTQATAARSYVQVAKILLWLIVGIVVVAALLNKNPTTLLAGLGAVTTVLLLVFKDSILGFVASIQLTRDNLIHKGDWIEVPAYGADGDVMEVTLHAVKVRNWDKTIVTVPTPALVTGGFKNWRGMSISGGRRIKRAISIDMSTVRFLDEEWLGRLKKIQYIQDYLDEKVREVQAFNQERKVDESSLVNGRRLTNLGTFRAYVQAYLENHPQINRDMTFLIRQLAPGPEGIPIEIYVFSKEQRWVQYEAIIGDIFDHLLAVVPEFGLRVFQAPAGADWRAGAEAASRALSGSAGGATE